MDEKVITYGAYIVISVLLTVWVARTLHKNGRVFLIEVFGGDESLADSVNHLLVVGFYLINFGYVTLALRIVEKIEYAQQGIEALSYKIGLVLLVGLRDLITVLRVMLPIGSALVVMAALLHALGERFSLFHLASFLLVIGLGLDYALFFNRRHGTPTERGRTVFGLVVCSTTTISVFGVLALSQIPVLRAIGMTTALGSLACLAFAALLAESPEKPSLLAATSPE